ncbi:MAG TPA: hypothetical protein VM889_06115 [Candidatus Thermoplasmatota archaeon]|nr:hypothetical protein [Candidatus Thermoplasmatota archaeon]
MLDRGHGSRGRNDAEQAGLVTLRLNHPGSEGEILLELPDTRIDAVRLEERAFIDGDADRVEMDIQDSAFGSVREK